MIAREEARLRALFQRLLLLSVATSPLACSSSSDDGGSDGGPKDATTNDAELDAKEPVDAPKVFDAGEGVKTDPYGFVDAACDPVPLDGGTDGSGCDFLETLPCGLPAGVVTDVADNLPCYILLSQCAVLCNETESLQRVCAISECLNVDASAIPNITPLTLECATGAGACAPGAGRRPAGLRDAAPARRGDAVGAVLADTARLEAASVHAFRRLGAELTSMRAPRSLVRAAARSARDEVRHARVMSRLARRHGGVPARVTLERPRRARSLEAFAIENAVEGCVRESFGALVAARQASHAPDRELARAMGSIASDEARHAALAWAIARWVRPRLSAGAQARLRQATRDALAALRCEVESTSHDLAHSLGLPAGRDGVALVDAFSAALFGDTPASCPGPRTT
jgi:hypothetical protein